MKKIIYFFYFLPLIIVAQNIPYLDTSFNSTGSTLLSVYNNNYANCTAVQPDKKVLVGGRIAGSGLSGTTSYLVARYHENGTLDNTFGNNGLLYTTGNNGSTIYDIKVLSDGKILIAGAGYAAYIERLHPDGSLDTTFGIDGRTTLSASYIRDLEVLSDGSILAFGDKYSASYLTKLNQNGQLDTTFGTYGETSTKFGYSSLINNAMTVQTDGKVLISGSVVINSSYPKNNLLYVARYNKNGSIDTSFANNGLLLYSATAREARDLIFTPAGKILILAEEPYALTTSIGPTSFFYLLQFDTDGTLDTGFNGTGIRSFGPSNYSSLKMDSQNRIYLCGSTFRQTNYYDFRNFVRLHENGSLDNSFGTNGIFYTNQRVYPSEFRYGSNNMNFTPDGKLVSSAYVNIPSFSIILMRIVIESTSLSSTDLNFNSDNISIYPNPSSDYFNIKSNNKVESLELINVEGQSLIKNRNTKILDARKIIKGSYFIKLKTNKEEKVIKVIKK